MSDNWIKLIPEEPGCVPSDERQQQALNKFRGIAPDADEIEIRLTDKIRFVDCGQNFQRVSCPDCGKELAIGWWQEQMDKDYDSNFNLHSIKLPCCGAVRNLHEISYDWPQGFARFSLEAMNPNLGKLPQHEVASFEKILGCRLRLIHCHL